MPPKNPHKHGANEKIDPEKYKDFIGDLQLDIRKVPHIQRKIRADHNYGLIENAIPNDGVPRDEDYLDLGYNSTIL